MAKPYNSTVGWSLDRGQRAALLAEYPPAYPDAIADHVTLASGIGKDGPLPPEVSAEMIGHVDDDAGVEAMIVSIDGATDRPDGSTFHITWSLDRARGREAIESNDVIARLGWTPLAAPCSLRLTPARFP